MRPALAILAAVLLLAGCAGKTTSASTASPSSSPSPVFTVPTRLFSSAALGVSFRCPAAWPRTWTGPLVRHFADDISTGGVGFRGQDGQVGAYVSFIRPAKHEPPYPFADADNSDLAQQRSSTGNKILYAGLTTIDGLRLVEIESISGAPRGVRPWRFLEFTSAGEGGMANASTTSSLLLFVGCPASEWAKQRGTLMAILASMQFSRPRG